MWFISPVCQDCFIQLRNIWVVFVRITTEFTYEHVNRVNSKDSQNLQIQEQTAKKLHKFQAHLHICSVLLV